MTTQGTEVTLTIPNEAPPGTFLSVPVRNGLEKIKVRVPEGLGAGSTIILQQMESSDDWDVRVGTVVPLHSQDSTNGVSSSSAAEDAYLREQAALEQAWQQQQSKGISQEELLENLVRETQAAREQQATASAARHAVAEEAFEAAASIEYINCNGLQLPFVPEQHLRTLHVNELREHAEFLYRTFGHERLGMAPPQEYAEVLSWVVQVQALHIEPLRGSDPAPPMDSAVAYTVRLGTTAGVIDIIVRPDWAPAGTRRFLELAASGDLNDLAFYRAIRGCIVQFGLPAKRKWPAIPDDPTTGVPFLLGAVSFAAVGENSRKSTLFICIGDMSHCLGQNSWETPIGAVAESSLDVLDRIETRYGDIAEFNGEGPDTSIINLEGNAYLKKNFPELTYITEAKTLDWFPETKPESQEMPSPPRRVQSRSGIFEEPTDKATVASQAAQEAQMQAQRAEKLAQQAASASQAVYASRAAEAALAAAEAAKAAMLIAQEAREAQAAEAAERKSSQAAPLEDLSPVRRKSEDPPSVSSPSIGATPPAKNAAVVQPSGGSAALPGKAKAALPTSSGPSRTAARGTSVTPGKAVVQSASMIPPIQPDSIDVPVEVMSSRQRSSIQGALGIASAPPVQRASSSLLGRNQALPEARDPRHSTQRPSYVPTSGLQPPQSGSGSLVMSSTPFSTNPSHARPSTIAQVGAQIPGRGQLPPPPVGRPMSAAVQQQARHSLGPFGPSLPLGAPGFPQVPPHPGLMQPTFAGLANPLSGRR